MKRLIFALFCLPVSLYCAETVIFDFKDDKAIIDCKQFVDGKSKPPEPSVKFSAADEHAAEGSRALKLEFDGGFKPCVSLKIPEASANDFFSPTLIANVYVSRTCIVGFRLLPEGGVVGKCWEKLARLEPGMNKVKALLVPNIQEGAPKELHIYMYSPKKGEVIWLSSIGVSTLAVKTEAAYSQYNPTVIGLNQHDYPMVGHFPKLDKKIKILGTDIEAVDGRDLWTKIKNLKKPEAGNSLTAVQTEEAFRAEYETIKKAKPKAVMALFRQDDSGFDRNDPARKYTGWSDAELQGHDPASGYANHAMSCRGKLAKSELFLRRRCCLMRADLSVIPAGSEILKATLMIIRNGKAENQSYAYASAVWGADACNRKWVEAEVNCVEYAKDKFWKEIDGMCWSGDDPDFLPLMLACQVGCGGGDGAGRWDFTEAVKYWTDGKHENNGFSLWSMYDWDYFMMNTKEAADIKDRPAMMVIYEPK